MQGVVTLLEIQISFIKTGFFMLYSLIINNCSKSNPAALNMCWSFLYVRLDFSVTKTF